MSHKKSQRQRVKDYLVEKLGYWNYVKEVNDDFTVHRDGTVECYAYSEDGCFHVDEIDDEAEE